MPVPVPDTPVPGERDLPRYLGGLVDTCFEEGHYESGLSTLTYMASPQYKPSEHHLRFLLYLALYPPEPPVVEEPSSKRRKLGLLSSPVKARSRSAMPRPTPEHSASALTLLHALVRTNTPASCAAALPTEGKRGTRSRSESDDDAHNEFVDASSCISRARSAWELLMPGIVKSMDEKGKKAEYATGKEQEEDAPRMLADHAIPVLDWLVTLWEYDAATDPQHSSSLLLAQLPPSAVPNAPRQEMNMPIAVIGQLLSSSKKGSQNSSTSPLKMESFQRVTLAARLLSLLVACALTSPPSLSPSTVVRQTSHILPDVPTTTLQILINNVSPISAGQTVGFARYKTALLALYLAQTSVNGVSEGLTGGTPMKSRIVGTATARTGRRRPRALHTDGLGSTASTPASTAGVSSATPEAPKPIIPEVYPIPSPTRVIGLLSLAPKPIDHSPSSSETDERPSTPPPREEGPSEEALQRQSVVKMLLLRALDELHVAALPLWTEAIQAGKVMEAVEEGKWWDGVGLKEMAKHVVQRWAKG